MAIVLTVDELAKRLRIGRSSAYKLIENGDVRSVRVGRSIRIPADAVDDFLQARDGPDSDE